jgi:hypothetical protein
VVRARNEHQKRKPRSNGYHGLVHHTLFDRQKGHGSTIHSDFRSKLKHYWKESDQNLYTEDGCPDNNSAVTGSLAHVASFQTSEEYIVKVHTGINVESGMSHLTKLFLADKKSGKRLFATHQFMVTVGQLAVATVSDKNGVFELLITNSTNSDIQYKRNHHIGEADSLLNWTPIAKLEVGNWTEQGAAKVSCNTQQRDRHNRRPHTAEDTEKIKYIRAG